MGPIRVGVCVRRTLSFSGGGVQFSGELGIEVKGVDFLVAFPFQLHDIFY